jgi:hypothetical protein
MCITFELNNDRLRRNWRRRLSNVHVTAAELYAYLSVEYYSSLALLNYFIFRLDEQNVMIQISTVLMSHLGRSYQKLVTHVCGKVLPSILTPHGFSKHRMKGIRWEEVIFTTLRIPFTLLRFCSLAAVQVYNIYQLWSTSTACILSALPWHRHKRVSASKTPDQQEQGLQPLLEKMSARLQDARLICVCE